MAYVGDSVVGLSVVGVAVVGACVLGAAVLRTPTVRADQREPHRLRESQRHAALERSIRSRRHGAQRPRANHA
jgi:hypothetical protein